MSTTTASSKINLTAKAKAFHAGVAAEKRAAAVSFVETTIIPYLTEQANKGAYSATVSYPDELLYSDIYCALTNRVDCKPSRTGTGNKIRVVW